MFRKRMSTFLVLVLLATMPGVGLAHHGPCYYDPVDMRSYGCTDNQARVIGHMVAMVGASLLGDWEHYQTARSEADTLNKNHNLGINIDASISHFQVLDSVMVGPNIKFTTLPNGALLMEDRFGRPFKIAGTSSTGKVKAVVNWWLALFGGMAAGSIGELVLWGTATRALIISEGVASAWWTYTVDALPESGETEYVIHLLHTVDRYGEQVYRANIRVKADGKITVKASWKFLGWRTPGGDW